MNEYPPPYNQPPQEPQQPFNQPPQQQQPQQPFPPRQEFPSQPGVPPYSQYPNYQPQPGQYPYPQPQLGQYPHHQPPQSGPIVPLPNPQLQTPVLGARQPKKKHGLWF